MDKTIVIVMLVGFVLVAGGLLWKSRNEKKNPKTGTPSHTTDGGGEKKEEGQL